MKRYSPKTFSAILLLIVFSPCQILAASITETKAAIGKNCTASGIYSTAMGFSTTASTNSTTAMGYYTTASGFFSTAMGAFTTAEGEASFSGGVRMQLTDTATSTFVWGRSNTAQSISVANAFLIFPAGYAGKVGIGTKNPQNLLDLGESQGKKLAVFQKTTGEDFYGFGITSATLEIYAGAASADINPAMVVKKTSGNIGIGTNSPNYLLEVDGSAGKPGGGSWSNSSDERFKDITGEYTYGLEEIARLNPVTFYYKTENHRGLPSDKEYIGFIAQEVQKVFPEAVSEGPDGYLDFNMHPVNVAVVNAIKELKAENDDLKTENARLKRDVEKIKAILGI
jgi:endosialidase-like protein/trimeric autotransporter adhesin